ncbi:MAG TPA: ATP-binding protein [Thermoanaerobaculia bacterium]|nr:ATP-binding protein [Thermoanaerobaculia bacterium]
MAAPAILREVKLTLPIAPDMEIAASKTATALAEFMRMSADKIDEVRMAVVEACINAIEHSRAPDRKVYLTFEVLGESEPEVLRITVRDQGVGFVPEKVEEPTIERKISAERKRGWGLKIIRGLMDDVEIVSGADGTSIVMTKVRG